VTAETSSATITTSAAGTKPSNPDTAGDRYGDGAELAAGSNPLDPASVPGGGGPAPGGSRSGSDDSCGATGLEALLVLGVLYGRRLAMKRAVLRACLAGILAIPAWGQSGQAPPRSELERKADSIRPTATELGFKKIPWVTDVFEGFRLAKAEKRPVLLYIQFGDPLEDC